MFFDVFFFLSFEMAFGAHFCYFGSLLGSLLETIWVAFWVPFLYRFLDPQKTSKNGGAALPGPPPGVHAPPSSDSSPLVNPLRVLPHRHRMHRASQSFPEQQTSASAFITHHQHSCQGPVLAPRASSGEIQFGMGRPIPASQFS